MDMNKEIESLSDNKKLEFSRYCIRVYLKDLENQYTEFLAEKDWQKYQPIARKLACESEALALMGELIDHGINDKLKAKAYDLLRRFNYERSVGILAIVAGFMSREDWTPHIYSAFLDSLSDPDYASAVQNSMDHFKGGPSPQWTTWDELLNYTPKTRPPKPPALTIASLNELLMSEAEGSDRDRLTIKKMLKKDFGIRGLLDLDHTKFPEVVEAVNKLNLHH